MHEVNLFWVICTKALADGDDVEEDHEDGVTEEGESEKKVDSMVRKGSWHSHINMRDRQTEVSLGGKFVRCNCWWCLLWSTFSLPSPHKSQCFSRSTDFNIDLFQEKSAPLHPRSLQTAP